MLPASYDEFLRVIPIYSWFSQALREEYEEAALLKETFRGGVPLGCV